MTVYLFVRLLAGSCKHYCLELPEKNQKETLSLNFESDLDHKLDKIFGFFTYQIVLPDCTTGGHFIRKSEEDSIKYYRMICITVWLQNKVLIFPFTYYYMSWWISELSKCTYLFQINSVTKMDLSLHSYSIPDTLY